MGQGTYAARGVPSRFVSGVVVGEEKEKEQDKEKEKVEGGGGGVEV